MHPWTTYLRADVPCSARSMTPVSLPVALSTNMLFIAEVAARSDHGIRASRREYVVQARLCIFHVVLEPNGNCVGDVSEPGVAFG